LEREARSDRLALAGAAGLRKGLTLEELRDAVAARAADPAAGRAQHRRRRGRATRRGEIAELADADLDLLQRASAALGLPYPDPDERILTDADLEAARRTKAFYDAGLPEEGILQVARTIGMATARIAEGNREPDDPHPDAAGRHRARPGPCASPTRPRTCCPPSNRPCSTPCAAHTLEQIRRDVIGAADLASGEIRGSVDRAVCFADLVEFTRLGEEIAPEELGFRGRPLRGNGGNRRRAAGAAGEDDRRRGDARLE